MVCCLQEMQNQAQAPKCKDQLFGQYIAQQLEAVPNGYIKDKLKLDIQQLIFNAVHSEGPLSLSEQVIKLI